MTDKKIVASYEWRDFYVVLPRKINGHWRYFETVERRRILREDIITHTSMTLVYEWEYRIKEYNKIPGVDRPFEPGVDDK